MAKAGLLYTGQLEEVKCPFCGISISDWQYGDQVVDDCLAASTLKAKLFYIEVDVSYVLP